MSTPASDTQPLKPSHRPPRVIAVMNQKGGVGKTTTSVNLGAALAEAGRRVCMIDLDPQAHLTINFGVEPARAGESFPGLYEMLVDGRSFLESVHKVDDNVALVASSIDLAGAELELVSVLGREMLLKNKLESAQHDFDFLLLDCPPSLGLLTINALAAAGEVIIPMQPHFLALQGVAKLLETVQLVNRRMNPRLRVSGIVLTMFDAQTKLSGEVVNELQSFIEQAKGSKLPWSGAKIFSTKIRRNIKLAESPSFGQTIIKYDPTSNGAYDYRALAREVLAMTGEVVPAPAVKPKPVVVNVAAAGNATVPVVTAAPASVRETTAKSQATPPAAPAAPAVAAALTPAAVPRAKPARPVRPAAPQPIPEAAPAPAPAPPPSPAPGPQPSVSVTVTVPPKAPPAKLPNAV